MGAGQRTTAGPIRRHPRVFISRLGSKSPKWVPRVSTAGARVSAAASETRMPIAAGMPRVWKYGSRVKLRQNTPPAAGAPEPKTGVPALVITAEEEYRVVRTGRDDQ